MNHKKIFYSVMYNMKNKYLPFSPNQVCWLSVNKCTWHIVFRLCACVSIGQCVCKWIQNLPGGGWSTVARLRHGMFIPNLSQAPTTDVGASTFILTNFSKKLHQIEKKIEGGGILSAPSLGFVNGVCMCVSRYLTANI